MLIPSGFIKLPSETGCYNDQVVMGSTVSMIASSLAQLTHCKFLGEAHYQVSHSTYGGWSTAHGVGSRLNPQGKVESAYKSYEYNFLYQSTPLSEHLAILMVGAGRYDSGQPDLTISLHDTASSSYSGTTLDHGIKFLDLPYSTSESSAEEWVFTGTELNFTPTNTSPATLVRPLLVPALNRGQLLNLKVTVNNFALSGFHIYDVYQVEVTP